MGSPIFLLQKVGRETGGPGFFQEWVPSIEGRVGAVDPVYEIVKGVFLQKFVFGSSQTLIRPPHKNDWHVRPELSGVFHKGRAGNFRSCIPITASFVPNLYLNFLFKSGEMPV